MPLTDQAKIRLAAAVAIISFIVSVVLLAALDRANQSRTDAAIQALEVKIDESQQKIKELKNELILLRSHISAIREIAAKAKTRIIEHKTEVVRENSAVDAMPASQLEPALRAIADDYIARHPEPGTTPEDQPDR